MRAHDGESVVVNQFTANVPSGNEFETPAAGKECDQVQLTFTNGSTSEWEFPTAEIGIVDANGQKYSNDSFDCATGDSIDSIVAGGHASAKELFEVPVSSPLNLSWIPNPFESEGYETKLR